MTFNKNLRPQFTVFDDAVRGNRLGNSQQKAVVPVKLKPFRKNSVANFFTQSKKKKNK